jgi:RimJ/RimL family protein N-acetyltransferase
VQELLGHRDVTRTMIYTDAVNRGPGAVRSPLDGLATGAVGLRTPTTGRVPDPIGDLWANPEAMRHMAGARPRDTIRTAFSEIAAEGSPAEEHWWVLEAPDSGRFIGQCGLCPKELEGVVETELVYLIAPPFWRRGFATEAARYVAEHAQRDLSLHRLITLIERGNTPSEIVAKRVGFVLERRSPARRPRHETIRERGIS